MSFVPNDFARATVRRYGATGQAWLDRLPAVLEACAARWELTLGPPFAPLSLNYVASVVQADGTVAIFKAVAPHPPDERAFAGEREALRHFDGRGAARLLESDEDDAVLLLERCEPGTPLRSLVAADDERATCIACDVMWQLWLPPPPSHSFPTMEDWNDGLRHLRPRFGGGTGPFPAALIAQVETLVTELTASAPAPMLLHGDLHHDNILAAGRSAWLAIDPKGLIGDPAYEIGALLYNPQPELLRAPNPARVLARRVDQCAAELGLDRVRVRGWAVVRATLAAWWTAESSGVPWAEALACAELLAAMRA